MASSHTDMSGFMKQLANLKKARPELSASVMKLLARQGAVAMVNLSPRDTNRYVRAWMMACNQAGLGPFTLPALAKSRYLEYWADRLQTQKESARRIVVKCKESVNYWETIYTNRYVRIGRHDRWARITKGHVDKAKKRLDKAQAVQDRVDEELLLLNQYSIVIGGKRRRAGPDVVKKLSDVNRVSNRPYGGEGAMFTLGEAVYVRLHNMEPHALIVEHNLGVARKATAVVKSLGVEAVRGKASKMLAEKVGGEKAA